MQEALIHDTLDKAQRHALKGAGARLAAALVAVISGQLESRGMSTDSAEREAMLARLEGEPAELQRRLIALNGDPS